LKMICIIIAVFLLSGIASADNSWPGLPPDCWTEPRIVHTHDGDRWKKLKENFKIDRIRPEKPIRFENVSPNKGYSYKQEGFRPAVTITINAEKEHVTVLSISQVYGVSDIKWINEKLLFMRIWWGRIAIDDVIFDVEREALVYTEPAVDGYQAFQQYQDSCKMLGGCTCIKKQDPDNNSLKPTR